MALTIEMKRRTKTSFAILLLCAAALSNSLAGPPPLPSPSLVFVGAQNYVVNGQHWIRYNLRVINFAAYPNHMFAPAPYLPACGNNAKASRTWVDIYDASNDKRLYGFCALGASQDLTKLWFAVKQGGHPP
ncbi:MAG: hypothetical protein MOB07_30920, partial [Acidobacteria bacterium]|nr:hypothetical protein [Acidobacteriota bacterium]